ncbi:DUF1446-domain-containing protein [Aspergillus pseudoustus]|uniref:DUF1446-domain-containing protein n=1 Tax=Aspergillus pseudoustus TaxID=1810923 RepID=A0ABR4J559_9EURO
MASLKHMLSGPTKVDAITGDWLSEFNLASRGLQKESNPLGGYEPGLLYSMKIAIDDYLRYGNKDLKFAVNAGGLNPRQLALEVQKLLQKNGSSKKVAYVTGDNVVDRIDSMDIAPLTRSTGDFASWKRKHGKIVTANVYIGCWGIVSALNDGADIVICGRCTDASPVIALAAWWHQWKHDDFDKLAGCLVAGHLIECGCYVCGGNFAGFEAMGEDFYDLSFPIAEIAEDGTCVIQKQPNQNGMMTVDTVKTQFVYELQGLYYYNPDIIADLTNVEMEQLCPGRVRVCGAKGMAAPETMKVAVMAQAGYQAEISVYITGLNAVAKARSFHLQSLKMLDQSKFQILDFQLYGTPRENPRTQLEATVQLRVFAQAKDARTIARGSFLGPLLSNQLQGYPGLQPHLDYRTADPKPYVTYYPGLISHHEIRLQVHHLSTGLPGTSRVVDVPNNSFTTPSAMLPKEQVVSSTGHLPLESFGPTTITTFGDLVYSRSGDKGANVNVGFFFPMGKDMEMKWEWLRSFLSQERFCELLGGDYKPGTFIDRCEFPKIRAVHFVIHGTLGAGVSSTSNIDALGKNVGEYIRAKHVAMPTQFLVRYGNI